jgi:mRNA interferase MazF
VSDLLRGRVLWFEIEDVGRKPGVILTNDASNRALRDCYVARITTTPQSRNPDAVRLGQGDPLTGWVLCRNLLRVYDDEVLGDAGALTPATMQGVNAALVHAFGLG